MTESFILATLQLDLEGQAMEAGRVERSRVDRPHPLAGDSSELVLKLDLAWVQGLVAVEQMDS